ncbi:MAG: SigB/SigF/SigG family RNA polymerase sigma factor [Butyrivibrio sp.]|nr:SigB/SigF/SigG family RNA polymerase sigma factor [Butyrivibrio sp.]
MDHTKELIELAHNGSREARDMLVLENMGLVYSISKRFRGRGYDMEDINQIGTIGLIKAIDKFDLSLELMFSTYAVPMIMGEIKRFIRDDGLIKISRSIKENNWKIKAAAEKISNTKGHEATVEEIAQATGLSIEDVVVAGIADREVDSIYREIYQGDGSSNYIVDKLAASASETENESVLNKIMINEGIKELKEDERELIRMRYYEDMTQTDIAKIMGISQVQVSRLEKRILLRMRKRMET